MFWAFANYVTKENIKNVYIDISEYQNYLEQEWLDILKQKYEVNINENVLSLLKQNKLHEINFFEEKIDDVPIYKGTFSQAYRAAVKKLGSSKENYFIWRGKKYTTEQQ